MRARSSDPDCLTIRFLVAAMKDNVGQRAPAHRSPRQDPCFDPLIRSPVSRDSRAAASGSFLDWKGLRGPSPLG